MRDLIVLVAAAVVVGEDGRLLLELVGVEVLDGSPMAACRALRRWQQALVGDVLDDRVLEGVLLLGEELLVDELQVLERGEVESSSGRSETPASRRRPNCRPMTAAVCTCVLTGSSSRSIARA